MGQVKSQMLEEISEEFECRYGDMHASPEDVEAIDVFYEWLEKVDLGADNCLDNDGEGGGFSLDITLPEDQESDLVAQLQAFYAEKNYGAEVSYEEEPNRLIVTFPGASSYPNRQHIS